MTEIQETRLPGVGLRYEFTSAAGDRLGVIHHRTGRRELFVGDSADPDACRESLDLDESESRILAELLGGSRITEHLTDLQQAVRDLAIDWLTMEADSPYVGRTIADAHIRTRTGVSVVAVIRGDEAHPAPEPSFRFEPGDTLVVVGTSEGIEALSKLLATG